MAFKVENDYNEYKVSIGTRKTFQAANLDEVKLALEHYFGKPYHGGKVDDCPLCE